MKNNLYYRNKYIIGLYTMDKYETCITVVDNLHEFAKLMEITPHDASVILRKAFNKKINYIIFNHFRVKIEFVNNNYI